jgi:alpha-glucosidase
MKTIRFITAALLLVGAARAGSAVRSPGKRVAMTFVMQQGGAPAYAIAYRGKTVVHESRLGFEPDLTSGFEVVRTSTQSRKQSWKPVYGERSVIPDNYSELSVELKHRSGGRLRIDLRAYDEGAALRYTLLNKTMGPFTAEKTEFRFPEGTRGYEEHGTEGEYKLVSVGSIAAKCERPLTLEYASGFFASLTEAGGENYPRTLLSPLADDKDALFSDLGGPASLGVGQSTPWRVFIIGDKPGDLLEQNYLVLNLNDPTALSDTSWIKPGKAMRDVTLSTTNARAIVDFAAAHNLQYVGFDWGWYGTEDPDKGDATRVDVDMRRTRAITNHPGLDLPEIIRYGQERNVGVVLYVDRRQIRKQRDVLFPLYEKWGVKGVKIGFIDVGTQEQTAWLTETVRKAAEHKLMLDIHDQYRTTGYTRTYPNLLTVEGIRGNEHMPTAAHNATLPFTRYVAGSGDYTVCYYTDRIKTTHAHQLAMTVLSYSPMQWVFWYDKPSDYAGEPEIEFFERVPVVWDDTKVLHGKIGAYASLARRSGSDWFIGTITDSEARSLELSLKFLKPGVKYIAHIYSDDPSAPTRTKVRVDTKPVDSRTILKVDLSASGGQAVWIEAAAPGVSR